MRRAIGGCRPACWLFALAGLALGGHAVPEVEGPLLEVGVARIDITPQGPVRLQGFPHRGRQEGITAIGLPLKARAIAWGRDDQRPVLLITADLLGVSAGMKRELLARLARRIGFDDPSRLTLTAVHTHSAPALSDVAPYIFKTEPTAEQAAHIAEYRTFLMDQLEAVAVAAMADRRPARVALRRGTLEFAVNRRVLDDGRWTGFGVNPAGPVARQMPMITVTAPDGTLRAVWVNYACHAVSWLEPSVHGDWTEEASGTIESRHPGALAFLTVGCAGDQNPTGIQDNRARAHGAAVADEVDRLLHESARALTTVPAARMSEFELPLADPLPVEVWEEQPKHWYAQEVQATLARGESLPVTVPYVAQTWSFGDELAMVFLSGEVVLDYALRLRRETGDDGLWVTAFANAAPGYIPSKHMVLQEGGYEVDGSRLTYGVPTRFAPATEDLIVNTVRDLLAPTPEANAKEAAVDNEWWKNNGHPRGAWWRNSKNYQGAEADEIWQRIERPPAPVRTPEAALDTFLVPEGFRVELVAAEPLVTRPVFMRFDATGRLWVVEMNGYMRDVDATGEADPSGRVVVLEDEDGDGRMDKSTSFMEGLVMPRTLAFVPGGVLVAEPPRIWFAEDTDGDLKADRRNLVADDYGTAEGPEHSANGLLPTMDNWMYSAKSAVRYRFENGELISEPTVFRGQWGITQDDGGRLYYNYNSSPLHADLVPGQYLADEASSVRPPRENGKTPLLVNVSVADDFSLQSAHVTPLVTLGASDLNEDGTLKKYSAACAPLIYRGDLLPAAYRGNAFICEPVGNLIGRFVVRGDAGTLQAKVVREDDREFLISTDERFRPVHLETGPDGAIYIADMYTGIIEHRMFVTEYLRGQLVERGFNHFTATGRIYRLVPDVGAAPVPVKLAGKASAELVKSLAHPNGWVRDTAQRLLVERADRRVLPALRHMVVNQGDPLARLHALWTCDGLNGSDEITLVAALSDPDPRVRAAALHVSESVVAANAGPRLVRAFRSLVNDADLEVRLQAMLSLGRIEKVWALAEMVELLSQEASPLLGSTAVVALQGKESAFLNQVMQTDDWTEFTPLRADVIELLAHAVQIRGKPGEVAALAKFFAPVADWRIAAMGKGLTSGQPNKEVPAAPALSAEEQQLFKIGETRYAQICIACHQADGQGLTNVAPALAGSRRANTSPEAAIRIVLHGLKGDPLSMAGFGSIPGLLDDEAIAGVLTYIRRSWGNASSPVTVDQVTAVRAETEGRTQPWSEAELETWIGSK